MPLHLALPKGWLELGGGVALEHVVAAVGAVRRESTREENA